jgi:predicted nuclease of predicted toxin-antitoxin system
MGMSAATDIEILEMARAREAAIVTLDADFHAILAVSGASAPSMIRIRQQGLKAEAFAHLLGSLLSRYEVDLRHGCVITVKQRKTTCHRLPIGMAGESGPV